MNHNPVGVKEKGALRGENDAVVLTEKESQTADYLLRDRTGGSGSGRPPNNNGRKRRKGGWGFYEYGSLVILLVIGALVISNIGILTTTTSETPVPQAINEAAPEQVLEKASDAPEVDQEPTLVQEPEVAPTIDPELLTSPKLGTVNVQAEMLKFEKVITQQVEPRNIGLPECQTESPAFNAVCGIKHAYGNKDTPEVMAQVMADNGGALIALADQGDTEAIALKEATVYEFNSSAEALIGNIPNLPEEILEDSAKSLGYYVAGLNSLGIPQEQQQSIIDRAKASFGVRVQTLEQAKIDALALANAQPAADPNTAPEAQAQPESLAQEEAQPAPEINPEPLAEAQSAPQPQSETFTVSTEGITVTRYSDMPVAPVLAKFDGLALSPEGVVRAVQQTLALFSLQTVKNQELRENLSEGRLNSNVFILWNTYEIVPGIWTFSLVEYRTWQMRKEEVRQVSPNCFEYMETMLRTDTAPGDLPLLRERWGQNACYEYLAGDEFNLGTSMLTAMYPDGSSQYSLHINDKGVLDRVSGVYWSGFGKEFPLKTGDRIEFRNIVVTLLQGLFN